MAGIAELETRPSILETRPFVTGIPSWFVVNTRHSADKYAFDFLTSKLFDYDVYWPRVEVGDGLKATIRSFLPRYLFVRNDGRGVGHIRNVPGVANMTRCGVSLAMVKQDVIEKMREREDERGLIRLGDAETDAFLGKKKKRFARGQKVKVILRSLGNESDFDALFQSMNGEHRAVIFADLLGKSTKMTVSVTQLEAA